MSAKPSTFSPIRPTVPVPPAPGTASISTSPMVVSLVRPKDLMVISENWVAPPTPRTLPRGLRSTMAGFSPRAVAAVVSIMLVHEPLSTVNLAGWPLT